MLRAAPGRLTVNQSGTFEGQHHVVNRGRSDPEEALEVGIGRRSAEDECIGVDESSVLALLGDEARQGRV
jgi:hypothetical protein